MRYNLVIGIKKIDLELFSNELFQIVKRTKKWAGIAPAPEIDRTNFLIHFTIPDSVLIPDSGSVRFQELATDSRGSC